MSDSVNSRLTLSVKTDCKEHRGNLPCRPHKEEGIHCDDCNYYRPVNLRILVIKLGAIGDVIRTTPLITKLNEVHPNCEITWLTYSPEVLPSEMVRPLKFNTANVVYLLANEYDLLLNLDKDDEAVALANLIKAKEKRGFKLENGKCAPINENAYHKFVTGLFDDVSRQNKKSYPEEIFELCGFIFGGEKYILNLPENRLNLPVLKGRVVGLNTGCGKRWPSRLWGDDNWKRLIEKIKGAGYTVLLLGGPEEDERNNRLAKDTGAHYFGTFPLSDFMQLVNLCELVVTQVTMALHLAIGLNKKIILLNNIFNKNEFELYGLGEIVEPAVPCKGCYKPECETKCMDMIDPDKVFEKITKLMKGN